VTDYLSFARQDDGSLAVAGELDMASVADLQAVVDEMVDVGGLVVVDLAGVTFIDSSGARLLLQAADSLKGRGSLTIRHPSRAVLRVFEVLGLVPAPEALPLAIELNSARPRGGPSTSARVQPPA